MWNVEMVRAKLGLWSRDDFATFREKYVAVGTDPRERSGRTTEMLLEATTAALNGYPVLIVIDIPSSTIFDWIFQVDPGIQPTIKMMRPGQAVQRYISGRAGWFLFFDHHCQMGQGGPQGSQNPIQGG